MTDPEENETYYSYDLPSGRMMGMSETENGAQVISYSYGTHSELTGITTPGTAYTFTYDQFGRSTSTKAGNVTLTTNEYAANNGNLTKTTYGNGESKNYSYDSVGRVTAETLKDENDNVLYSNSYTYNAFGLIGKVEDGRDGKVYDYSYDLTDRPLKVTISDGTVIQTRYNTENAVEDYDVRFRGEAASTDYHYSAVDRMPDWSTFNGSWVEEYDYDKLGRLKKKVDKYEWGDIALTTHYTYVDPDPDDPDKTTGLIDTIICEDGAGDEVYTGYRDYDYDLNGRISQIKVKDANGNIKTHSYIYDSKGQLTRHNDEEKNISLEYFYDTGGNIYRVKQHPYSTGNLILGAVIKENHYEDENWGDLLTSYGDALHQKNVIYYDDGDEDECTGNPIQIGDAELTWEGRELVGWDDGTDELTFSYDPDGYRVSKTVNNVTTDYLVSGGKILAESNGTDSIYYYYDSNGSIQAMKYGSTIYYYIKSAEGDILGLMNGVTGYVAATYSYDAWGVPTVTNIGNTTIGDINPFRYRGYYYDSETGLYYLGSRYYSPTIGRFISPDSVSYLGANGGFVSYNLFAYCENDPVNKKDDGGKLPHIIIGAIVGGVGGLIGQAFGDIVNYIEYGSWDITFAKYFGAFVGGAAGGAVLAATGNTGLSGAVSGFTSTFISQGTEKLTGKGPKRSWDDIIARSALDGAMGYAFGSCLGLVKKFDLGGYKSDLYRMTWEALVKKNIGPLGKAIFKQGLSSIPLGIYCAFRPFAK